MDYICTKHVHTECNYTFSPTLDTPNTSPSPAVFALRWKPGWVLSVSCAVICAFLYFWKWQNKLPETACKLQTMEEKGSCFYLSGAGAQITAWRWANSQDKWDPSGCVIIVCKMKAQLHLSGSHCLSDHCWSWMTVYHHHSNTGCI